MHSFEQAGLGKAPFRCVGVTENVWTSGCGTITKAGGTCDYCGTGIRYEYHIKSSDNKCFVVGCDCVAKTGSDVDDFKRVRTEFVRAKRDKKASIRKAEREALWKIERENRARYFETANYKLVEFFNSYTGDNTGMLSLIAGFKTYGSLTENQVKYAYSLIERFEKHEIAKATSKHVGVVGEKTNAIAKIVSTLFIGYDTTYYPHKPRFLVTLETFEQDQLIWWTSSTKDVCDFTQISFTVKEHGEYNGVKQTTVKNVRFK